MRTKEISLEQGKQLIARYLNAGGTVVEVDGTASLGLGLVILCKNAHTLKEFVIEEYYLNEWSSGHRLKTYTKGLPKKYRAYVAD